MNVRMLDLVTTSRATTIPVKKLRRYARLGQLPGAVKIGNQYFVNERKLSSFLEGETNDRREMAATS